MQTTARRRRSPAWVGPWLKEKREEHGTSFDEIVRRLKRSRSSASRLEAGVSSIASDDLPAVLAVYKVTLGEFAAKAKTVKAAA